MSAARSTLNSARRQFLRVQRRFGANGIAGLALIALATFGLWYAERTRQEAGQLHLLAAQVRARVDAAPAPAAVPARERLARFQNWFPSVETSTTDLRRIFRSAQSAHVQLTRGEYRLGMVDGSDGLQRLDVILPVREHYAAIRSFVVDVLNELPHASLAELHAEKPAAAADNLDTRVHFTIFYRARPA